jgi:nucleoside-diphosphate-sugar epimerase
MLNLKNLNILLTGGHGFLGQQVFKELTNAGAKESNIYRPRHKDLDLKKFGFPTLQNVIYIKLQDTGINLEMNYSK